MTTRRRSSVLPLFLLVALLAATIATAVLVGRFLRGMTRVVQAVEAGPER
jgi:hypothetical protein